MDDVVHLGSQHTLDEVFHVAKNHAIPLCRTAWCGFGFEGLDLEALQYRDRESAIHVLGVVEDGTVKARVCQEVGVQEVTVWAERKGEGAAELTRQPLA